MKGFQFRHQFNTSATPLQISTSADINSTPLQHMHQLNINSTSTQHQLNINSTSTQHLCNTYINSTPLQHIHQLNISSTPLQHSRHQLNINSLTTSTPHLGNTCTGKCGLPNKESWFHRMMDSAEWHCLCSVMTLQRHCQQSL